MKLSTSSISNWCPGCPNFMILAGVKKALEKKIKTVKDKEKFALVTGIGCHGKTYDYLNLNGINSLHGRVLPTMLGLKIGNPNLTVLGFSGDGDAYNEGMEHLIHAARYNADINYFVHDNQVFSLTVGQPTSTTQKGFSDKTTPFGVKFEPLNPILLMLSAGATMVARVFADVEQVEWIFNEALNHKGFSFVEIIQPCLIFHDNFGYKEKTYMIDQKKHDYKDLSRAINLAMEFNYDVVKKIPLGIFYKVEKPIFEDQFEALKNLKKNRKSWVDIKR